jgi:hypothetical protein
VLVARHDGGFAASQAIITCLGGMWRPMSNRTAAKPSSTRSPARAGSKATAKSAGYRRTTARLEGRRDGKPLFFGWGRHLTRAQKNLYQHTAAYSFVGLVCALVVGVLGFGWLQQTILIPNETIATVNDHNITQDSYRKQLAFEAQVIWNRIQAENKQLTKAEQAAKPDQNQIAILQEQIQSDEGSYGQSTITQTAITDLIEDQLLQSGARSFEQTRHVPASTFEPSAAAIGKQLQSFKTAFPSGETYQDFLAKNGMSESDVRGSLAMQLRRNMMQTYLASLLTSPIRQVHYRRIETDTLSKAQHIYDLIVHQHGDWNSLTAQNSVDVNTKNNGGDMNFVPPGSGDAGIEIWAYAPTTKVGDITVLKDQSGTFDVVQVLEIQDSRGYDPNMLSAAQSNALSHWLGGQKVAPFNKLTTPNQNMLTASRNQPVVPDLNATLPNVAPPNAGQPPTG